MNGGQGMRTGQDRTGDQGIGAGQGMSIDQGMIIGQGMTGGPDRIGSLSGELAYRVQHDPHPDMRALAGKIDVLFITLDTLRYDVAQQEWQAGRLPLLARHLPPGGWERRHSPASFTFAAHQAFFAGFLPTPARPGHHPRLFATAFAGSETTDARTLIFAQASLPAGFAAHGYHTVCIGGTGFFNPATPLGAVLPAMFAESHWHPGLGTSHAASCRKQVALACQRWQAQAGRIFMFINIAAIHAPNHFYLSNTAGSNNLSDAAKPAGQRDTPASHAAALRHVDAELVPLFAACAARGPTLVILCSDHGTAYGEDGYRGHRFGHAVVWDVPYAHFLLLPAESPAS